MRVQKFDPTPPSILTLALIAFAFTLSQARAETTAGPAPTSGRTGKEQQELCANIAASIESERLAKQQKVLGDIESQIKTKLAALETKEAEVSGRLERLETFERKVDESLIAFYTGMKPDAAAAHLSELDEDIAAGILLKLKTKSSSAILNEISAERGAALIKRIGRLQQLADGKSP
jgi:flagellar motility protein MotE (MotC chaperone)